MIAVALLVGALARSSTSLPGGAQRYAEQIKSLHIEHGAPRHPLHATRDT